MRHLAMGMTLAALSCSAVAEAQLVKGPVVGIIKSAVMGGPPAVGVASKVVLANLPPITTVGSGQVFVVTDIYCRNATSEPTVTFGGFVGGNRDSIILNCGNGLSVHFDPGLVVVDGADVTASSNGGASFTCAVGGIVTRKAPTPAPTP